LRAFSPFGKLSLIFNFQQRWAILPAFLSIARSPGGLKTRTTIDDKFIIAKNYTICKKFFHTSFEKTSGV
jgi:hypothetical protein